MYLQILYTPSSPCLFKYIPNGWTNQNLTSHLRTPPSWDFLRFPGRFGIYNSLANSCDELIPPKGMANAHINRNDLQLKDVERQQVGFSMVFPIQATSQSPKRHPKHLRREDNLRPCCRTNTKGDKEMDTSTPGKNGDSLIRNQTGMGFNAETVCGWLSPLRIHVWRSVIGNVSHVVKEHFCSQFGLLAPNL